MAEDEKKNSEQEAYERIANVPGVFGDKTAQDFIPTDVKESLVESGDAPVVSDQISPDEGPKGATAPDKASGNTAEAEESEKAGPAPKDSKKK